MIDPSSLLVDQPSPRRCRVRFLVENLNESAQCLFATPPGASVRAPGPPAAPQIVELNDQLRGRCGGRQVEGVRVSPVAENGGGFLGSDPAAAVVTILARQAEGGSQWNSNTSSD